ncbi:YaaL family protein [Salipaludibacillus sp. HK11]|uniref:YaaL family protein n=1 Tax=Salipaludibacillus sp. HK11 TaxID=3394320 RepID=UPI0039FC2493
MLKKKKRKLRRQSDEELITTLDHIKDKADQQESYLKNSIHYGGDVESIVRLERAKYLFLLREARARQTTFS